MPNPSYGDIIICIDPENRWYAHIGRVVGKNKENLGVAFEGDPEPPKVGRWVPKTSVASISAVEPTACPPIRSLRLKSVWIGALKEVTIPITPGRHLILTGPNGSGKTTILKAIWAALKNPSAEIAPPPVVELVLGDDPLVGMVGRSRHWWPIVWLPADRAMRPTPVSGPQLIDWNEVATGASVARLLPQYLVNRRFDQSIAREEGNHQEADAIARWFAQFHEMVRDLFDEPDLELSFDRNSYRFTFDYPDGRQVGFENLPDGFSSVLSIWGELHLRCEAWRRLHPGTEMTGGFVVIDELETHLHLSLQARILPFLTTMFPTFQFIVATHSPAVLSSVEDATIFDLREQEAFASSTLKGIRYGNIVTGCFGLESDYPVSTARELVRLGELSAKEERTPQEWEELRLLGQKLRSRSRSLAFEVWSILGVTEEGLS